MLCSRAKLALNKAIAPLKFLGRSVKPKPTLTLSPAAQGVSPSTSQFLGRAGLYQDQVLLLVSQQRIELIWGPAYPQGMHSPLPAAGEEWIQCGVTLTTLL